MRSRRPALALALATTAACSHVVAPGLARHTSEQPGVEYVRVDRTQAVQAAPAPAAAAPVGSATPAAPSRRFAVRASEGCANVSTVPSHCALAMQEIMTSLSAEGASVTTYEAYQAEVQAAALAAQAESSRPRRRHHHHDGDPESGEPEPEPEPEPIAPVAPTLDGIISVDMVRTELAPQGYAQSSLTYAQSDARGAQRGASSLPQGTRVRIEDFVHVRAGAEACVELDSLAFAASVNTSDGRPIMAFREVRLGAAPAPRTQAFLFRVRGDDFEPVLPEGYVTARAAAPEAGCMVGAQVAVEPTISELAKVLAQRIQRGGAAP